MPAQRPFAIGPVRWDDPLSNGLTGAWVADTSVATIRDLLGLNSATGSGLTATVGLNGRALQAAAFQAKATVAVKANLKPTKAASLFWLGTFDSAGSPTDDTVIHGVSFTNANSAPFTSYAVQRRSADPTTLSFGWSNNGTYTEALSVTGDMPSTGTPFSFCATLRMGGNGSIYINDKLSGTASAGTGPITYGAAPTLYVPGHMNSTAGTNNPGSSLAIAYSWNRDLTPEEVGRLAVDPWCLVRPRPRRLFKVVAGGALTGTMSALSTGTAGTLSGTGALTGTSAAVSTGTAGTLRGLAPLTGTMAASAAGTAGTLIGISPVSGTSAALATATSGTLTGTGALTAAMTASATATAGTLSGSGQLTGTSAALSTGTAGTLSAASSGAVTGTMSASASATAGTLSGTGALSGAMTAAATATAGTLSGAGKMTGTMSAAAAPSGLLSGIGALIGAMAASATGISGVLSGAGGALVGSVIAITSAVATFSLSAVSRAAALISGRLTDVAANGWTAPTGPVAPSSWNAIYNPVTAWQPGTSSPYCDWEDPPPPATIWHS